MRSVLLAGFLAAIQLTVESAESRTGMEFVRINPGMFRMGCSDGDDLCDPDEKPPHEVRISKEFEIGKYEVTQAQWRRIIGENPSTFSGENRPVENVSWNDTQRFLDLMNSQRDGYHYRLPTEAEWEYAARAGNTGKFLGNLDATVKESSQPVGMKQPNAWGLYDMQGNVWEWVEDWYGEKFYSEGAGIDPAGPRTGEFRVLRGGAWGLIPYYTRLSYRDANVPTYKDNSIGFRCVRQRG